jgi:hypothetical protein
MKSSGLFFLCFLALFTKVFGGNENLLLGARQAGLAGGGMCLADLWSVQTNQAALTGLEKTQTGVFLAQPFMVKELSRAAFAVAVPRKFGVLALSFNSMGYKLYRDTKLGLAFARSFGPNFSAALQLDYLSTYIGENYGTRGAIAAEVSLLASLTPKLKMGFHLFNPTKASLADYNKEKIPTIAKLGLGYLVSEKIHVLLEVEKDLINKPVIRAGLEYFPVQFLYIRAGVASNPALNAAGFGLQWKKVRIDLAASFHPQLGYTPNLGLLYSF